MNGWIYILSMGVVVGGVAVFVYFAERARKAGIASQLASRGVRVALRPDSAQRHEAFQRLGPYSSLNTGPDGVRLCGSGAVDGVPVTYVEHTYSTGWGGSRRTYAHSVLATPCPLSWRRLAVRETHLGDTVVGWFGAKDLQVEDKDFNNRWHISGFDPDFALLVLTPEVQDMLAGWAQEHILTIDLGVLTIAAPHRWTALGAGAAVDDLIALRGELLRNLGAA